MGRGIIDYLVRASMEPALLVTGVAWSLSGRGRAWIGGHDHFYGASDTPLVPPCKCFVMMWERGSNVIYVRMIVAWGMVSTSGLYVSHG
jgi:hypothetical protein